MTNRLAMISGLRAVGKRHHHDEVADLPALDRVRHRTIFARVPAAEELLAGDVQQFARLSIKERTTYFRREHVNAGDRIVGFRIGTPLKARQEGSHVTLPFGPQVICGPSFYHCTLQAVWRDGGEDFVEFETEYDGLIITAFLTPRIDADEVQKWP